MLAKRSRGIAAGQDGCLPRRRLRQSGDTQNGIQAQEGGLGGYCPGYVPGEVRHAEQGLRRGHGYVYKRIGLGVCIPEANTIEKNDNEPL
jgi:hypothetical protein